MANKKSAAKRARQSIKRHERNKSVLSAVKTAVRKTRELVAEAGDAGAVAQAARKAEAVMARAARKGVLHKRTAARRTSRLAKAVNKARAAAPKA